MDIELKTKWVEALRSGKYSQTTGMLKNDGGYCCLGVLCDVMGATWKDVEVIPCGRDEYRTKPFLDGKSMTDDVFCENISVSYGKSIGLDREITMLLAVKNDDGHSFEYIANYIEECV